MVRVFHKQNHVVESYILALCHTCGFLLSSPTHLLELKAVESRTMSTFSGTVVLHISEANFNFKQGCTKHHATCRMHGIASAYADTRGIITLPTSSEMTDHSKYWGKGRMNTFHRFAADKGGQTLQGV